MIKLKYLLTLLFLLNNLLANCVIYNNKIHEYTTNRNYIIGPISILIGTLSLLLGKKLIKYLTLIITLIIVFNFFNSFLCIFELRNDLVFYTSVSIAIICSLLSYFLFNLAYLVIGGTIGYYISIIIVNIFSLKELIKLGVVAGCILIFSLIFILLKRFLNMILSILIGSVLISFGIDSFINVGYNPINIVYIIKTKNQKLLYMLFVNVCLIIVGLCFQIFVI